MQEQHGGLGRLTCRDERQLRADGLVKSLPDRLAHVRTPLLDRLIACNVYREAILPSGAHLKFDDTSDEAWVPQNRPSR